MHAEGYAAGEMKHGPIALIDPGMTIVAINAPGIVADKVLVEHRTGQIPWGRGA